MHTIFNSLGNALKKDNRNLFHDHPPFWTVLTILCWSEWLSHMCKGKWKPLGGLSNLLTYNMSISQQQKRLYPALRMVNLPEHNQESCIIYIVMNAESHVQEMVMHTEQGFKNLYVSTSALAGHVCQTGHKINWENLTIINNLVDLKNFTECLSRNMEYNCWIIVNRKSSWWSSTFQWIYTYNRYIKHNVSQSHLISFSLQHAFLLLTKLFPTLNSILLKLHFFHAVQP